MEIFFCFGDLGDAVAGDLVGLLADPVAAALHLLRRPAEHVPDQVLPGD